MKTTQIQIRKYTNRKLYDEERGAYVSMLGLSDLVAGGAQVRVTCDRTGRDVTLEALSRSLYERVKVRDDDDVEGELPFSPRLLERLIARVRRPGGGAGR